MPLVVSVSGLTQDRADSNSILIDQIDRLFRIDDIALLGAVDVFLFDFEIASCLFPANLDRGVHDDVWLRVVLSLRLALILPSLLHGKGSQHDGFTASHGAVKAESDR